MSPNSSLVYGSGAGDQLNDNNENVACGYNVHQHCVNNNTLPTSTTNKEIQELYHQHHATTTTGRTVVDDNYDDDNNDDYDDYDDWDDNDSDNDNSNCISVKKLIEHSMGSSSENLLRNIVVKTQPTTDVVVPSTSECRKHPQNDEKHQHQQMQNNSTTPVSNSSYNTMIEVVAGNYNKDDSGRKSSQMMTAGSLRGTTEWFCCSWLFSLQRRLLSQSHILYPEQQQPSTRIIRISPLQHAIQASRRRQLLYSIRFWALICFPLVVILCTIVYYSAGIMIISSNRSGGGINNANTNGYYTVDLDNTSKSKILQQGNWRSNQLEFGAGEGGGGSRFHSSTTTSSAATTWMFGYTSPFGTFGNSNDNSFNDSMERLHRRTRNRSNIRFKSLFRSSKQEPQQPHQRLRADSTVSTTANNLSSKRNPTAGADDGATSDTNKHHLHHHGTRRQHRVVVDILSTSQGSRKQQQDGSTIAAAPSSNVNANSNTVVGGNSGDGSVSLNQQQQQLDRDPTSLSQQQHPNPAIYGWTPSTYPNPKMDSVSCGISYILLAHEQQEEEEKLQNERHQQEQVQLMATISGTSGASSSSSSSDYSDMGVIMDDQLSRIIVNSNSSNGLISDQEQQLEDPLLMAQQQEETATQLLLERTETTIAPAAVAGEMIQDNNVVTATAMTEVLPVGTATTIPTDNRNSDDSTKITTISNRANENLRLCDPDWMLGGLLLEEVAASMYNFSQIFSPDSYEQDRFGDGITLSSNRPWDVAIGGDSSSSGSGSSSTTDSTYNNNRNFIERWFNWLYMELAYKYRGWMGGISSSTATSSTADATDGSNINSNNNNNAKRGTMVLPPVELAVATVRKMNLLSVLRQGSYYAYEDQDDMVSDAAQIFARTLHDSWWNNDADSSSSDRNGTEHHGGASTGHQPGDYGILIFLSIQDRICFISTGSAVQHVLPWWRLDHIVASMKPDLRHQQYGSSIVTAISDLTSMLLAGPPSLSDRLHDFISRFGVVIAFAAFTFVFGAWGEYRDRRKRWQYAEQRSKLTDIEKQKALQLQKAFKTTSCPICLECFDYGDSSNHSNNKLLNSNIINKTISPLEEQDDDSTSIIVENDDEKVCLVGKRPASDTFRSAALPCTSSTISLTLEGRSIDGDEYGVPLRGADGKKIKILRCGHIFCDTCWKSWVHSGCGNPCKCPVCRQDIGRSGKLKNGGQTNRSNSGSNSGRRRRNHSEAESLDLGHVSSDEDEDDILDTSHPSPAVSINTHCNNNNNMSPVSAQDDNIRFLSNDLIPCEQFSVQQQQQHRGNVGMETPRLVGGAPSFLLFHSSIGSTSPMLCATTSGSNSIINNHLHRIASTTNHNSNQSFSTASLSCSTVRRGQDCLRGERTPLLMGLPTNDNTNNANDNHNNNSYNNNYNTTLQNNYE